MANFSDLGFEPDKLDGLDFKPDNTQPQQSGQQMLLNAAQSFGVGFNEGLAEIIGFPIDIVNAGLRTMGLGSERPFGGSESIKRGISAVGIPMPKHDDPVSRLTSRVGREIGASTVPFGVMGRVAQTAKNVPAALRPLIQPLINAPGRTAITELTGATGAGIGGGIAREAFPDSPLAEFGGQVVGGIAGTLPNLTREVGSRAFREARESIGSARAQRRAAEVLQKNIVNDPDTITGNIAARQKLVQEELGIRPTTAQASGDPGMAAIQRALVADPKIEGRIIGESAEQARVIRQRLSGLVPQGDMRHTAQIISDQVSAEKNSLASRLKQTQDDIRSFIAERGGSMEPEDLNSAVRTRLLEAEASAADSASKLFEAIPNAKVDIKDLRQQAKGIAKLAGKFERPENVPGVIGQVARSKNNLLDFKEVMALRSRVTDEIREEMSRLPRNRRAVSRLEQLKEAIDNTLTNRANTSDDAAFAYEEARQFFLNEVANKFRRGTAARILRGGALGAESAVPESATIKQFFKGGTGAKESADDFQRIFQNDQLAQQLVSEAAVQDFATMTLRPDGSLDVTKARQWLRKHNDALKVFPEVRNSLEAVTRKGLTGDVLKTNIDNTIEQIEKSAVRFLTDADPDVIAKQVLNSRSATKDLGDLVQRARNTPDAINGLRSGVWQEILRRSETTHFDESIGAAFISPTKLRQTFEKEKQILRQSGLYSSLELDRIDKIIQASEVIGAPPRTPSLPAADINISKSKELEKTTGLTIPGLLSRFYAVARGVVSPRFVVSEVLYRGRRNIIDYMTQNQVNKLLERAIIDPDLAQTLLSKNISNQTLRERLIKHLREIGASTLGTGSRFVGAVAAQPEPEENLGLPNIPRPPLSAPVQ